MALFLALQLEGACMHWRLLERALAFSVAPLRTNGAVELAWADDIAVVLTEGARQQQARVRVTARSLVLRSGCWAGLLPNDHQPTRFIRELN